MYVGGTILWLALCVLVGLLAKGKNRSWLGWFSISFFFSPLIGLIALLVAGKGKKIQPSSEKPRWENEPVGMKRINLTNPGRGKKRDTDRPKTDLGAGI